MEEKMQVVKKALYKKDISVELNSYLKIKQTSHNQFVFGENVFVVCDKKEKKEFILKKINEYLPIIYFYFQTIADILHIHVQEIENFYCAEILLNNENIIKHQNKYCVCDEELLAFLHEKITKQEFIEKLFAYLIKNKKLYNVLDFNKPYQIDGFYVYDVTDTNWLIDEFVVI